MFNDHVCLFCAAENVIGFVLWYWRGNRHGRSTRPTVTNDFTLCTICSFMVSVTWTDKVSNGVPQRVVALRRRWTSLNKTV